MLDDLRWEARLHSLRDDVTQGSSPSYRMSLPAIKCFLSSHYVPSDNGSFFESTEEQADAMEHISFPAGTA